MKHRVADLEGALLDAAVALASGIPGMLLRSGDGMMALFFKDDGHAFQPSRAWSYGGPIIDREKISTINTAPMREIAGDEWTGAVGFIDPIQASGPTALVAAMRAYVASKLGEEVELP